MMLLTAAAILLTSCGDSTTSGDKPATPPGDNLNYRTRIFVRQLHACQASVSLAASILQSTTDRIQLADAAARAKDVCDGVRSRMGTMDTNHFSDEALDAEVAVDEYSKGLADVSDYIDTFTPSKVVNARGHFGDARSYSTQAIAGINDRRAVYGLPPLH